MNKLFFKILTVIGIFSFTYQLNANCEGTSGPEPVVLCGTEEVNEAYTQATENCCAISIIYGWDKCTGNNGVWFITQDGSNSSCAVE